MTYLRTATVVAVLMSATAFAADAPKSDDRGPASLQSRQRVGSPGSERDVASLDPCVSQVVTGGSWERGHTEGQYRLIAYGCGAEHISHHLYVQFVKADARTQSITIVDTIPITETQDMNAVFRNIAIRPFEVHAPVVFEGQVGRTTKNGEEEQAFRLRVQQDGRYELTLTSAAPRR